jgi:hypothetical protein
VDNFIAEQVELDRANADDTCWSCGGEGGGDVLWGDRVLSSHVCDCCGGSGVVPRWMLPPRLTNDNWVAAVEAEMALVAEVAK